MNDYWNTLEDFMEKDIGEEEDVSSPPLKRKRKDFKDVTDE
jgi:hypothetical protein